IPSESEDESECDVPDCDDSQTINFSTFSNPLFDDFTSSDDESSHDEDIHKMSFNTYSNPPFDLDEEIISNRSTFIQNRSFQSNSTGIKEADFDLEEEIRLVENLSYDNSSPRPPRKLNAEIVDTIVESLSLILLFHHDEDIHEMSFKTYSNPLFDLDKEIISSEFNPIHNEDLKSTLKNDRFDTEPYLLESLPNRDTLMSSLLKIDSLFAEFAGALIFLKSIPPGIDEADCDPEEDIHPVKRLLYDNSSPRPPEEIVSDNSNVDIESFSPYPILNEDSASHMEEIDLFLNPDDPMPPGIEEDDDDSERDILILEELLDNYSLSLPANESYHFDIPSPYRPPAKPPNGKTGTLNIKMMGDVSDQKV
nr:hypothetical protein [Tanacetum cinerariifolium]